MIDTHCHFDMMDNPIGFIDSKEANGDIVIGMTSCPEHFKLGLPFIKNKRCIRLALGFHPQIVNQIQAQFRSFIGLINKTSYIGEIGLDFSREFFSFRDVQIEYFTKICQYLSTSKKIISIHSVKAENCVLDILEQYQIKIPILHWFNGSVTQIQRAVNLGCYFSINEAMTQSQKGKVAIANMPRDKILTETDAPFNKKDNIEKAIYAIGMSKEEIHNNFINLISILKS